eukprot:gb/GECG01010016.1/.p1 GENE.gb/GECG01010016.1/~~gb/GECG01010016.1/.p1  ORF type:complete len:338 (+),score=27.55 gb/GECG01010016.1/:1-1014(+)
MASMTDTRESTPFISGVDRAKGCLLGTAVGDAFGTAIEFRPPLDPFNPTVTDIIGKGPHRLRKGQWTDDTSMALCLADSLIKRKSLDLIDQLTRYGRWFRKGENSCTGRCFDIGNTTRKALGTFSQHRDPYSGSTNKNSAGNGSIMRIAPIPVASTSLDIAMRWGGEQSKTTHQVQEAVEGCQILSGMVFLALEGCSKHEILSHPDICSSKWSEKLTKVVQGSYASKEPPEIRGSGYVVDTLEAALWAFHKSRDFREGTVLVANLGLDADTTAATYGALGGAYYGLEGIPEEWKKRVAWSNHIQRIGETLYNLRPDMDPNVVVYSSQLKKAPPNRRK